MQNDDSDNLNPGTLPSAEAVSAPVPEQAVVVSDQGQLYHEETTNSPVDAAQTDAGETVSPLNQTDSNTTEDMNEEEPDETFSWNAPEFIHHPKNFAWYTLFALASLVLAALIFFLTKSIVSTSVVIVGALLLAYYSAKMPKEIPYAMNNRGITVGQRNYTYENFRSFSVVQEGTARSIVFMPQKRFALMLSIYYQVKDEEIIVGLLSTVLPMTEFSHDAVDRLMHRIRF
jgi:hypothetical protein